jgi:hypothetical protein
MLVESGSLVIKDWLSVHASQLGSPMDVPARHVPSAIGAAGGQRFSMSAEFGGTPLGNHAGA